MEREIGLPLARLLDEGLIEEAMKTTAARGRFQLFGQLSESETSWS